MKKYLALLLALVMCLSLAACGKKTGTTDQSNGQSGSADTSAEPLAADQTYNTYLTADPTTLDISLRSDSYSSTIMINTMEGLIRTGEKDGEYVVNPGLATEWSSNDDGTVWTFKLRDSKWEDGEAVTADQFVYSLQRSAAPETGSPSSFFLQPLKNFEAVNKGEMTVDQLGVKAIDASTLEITLENPTPSFLMMLDATVYYPQREDKVKEWGDKFGSEAQYYIANGPFKVSEWTHNSKLVLVKNDNYWDADNVKLTTVNFNIMPDETTYYNAFQSGELDYVSAGTKEWLDTFKATDAQYNSIPSATMTYSFYNNQDSLFKNVNVRKAFTLAIDRDDINEMCFSGLRIPAEGWVPQSMSVGEVNYRDKAGNMISELQDEMTSAGKTPKDLLIDGMKELGLGEDPSTLKVTFSLAGTSDWYRTLGDYLQQVYKTELGVEVQIDFSEWDLFYDNVQKGSYQIGFMGWGAYYNDPYDMLSLFVSSYDAIETGWASDKYDELIKASSSEMDQDKRIQDYIDAEHLLIVEDCVVSPLAVAQSNDFYKPYVHGFGSLVFNNMGLKTVYLTEKN